MGCILEMMSNNKNKIIIIKTKTKNISFNKSDKKEEK